MTVHTNAYGQPVGRPMPDWSPRPRPADVTLQGRLCAIEPLSVERHAHSLADAYLSAPDGRDWTYMFAGPFASTRDYLDYAQAAARSTDPKHYAVIDKALDRAVGTLSLMRIDPANGVIEVGNVAFSPLLRQTPAATQAQLLLMQYVFETLGYRRYEWKCDSLNAPSRRAAQRLGFRFEGIFRQAMVYKGRTRDTAWYAVIDADWPLLKRAMHAWLAADNFDAEGRQIRSLESIRTTLATAQCAI